MRYIICNIWYMKSRKTCISPLRGTLSLVLAALALALAASCASGRDAAAPEARASLAADTPEQLAQQNMLVDAKTQQMNGNTDKAMALLHAVLDKDAHCAAACYEMARLMASTQRLDSAVHYAERAKALSPSNEWYSLLAATLYQATNQADKLAREWESIVKLHPNKEEYYYELSNAYAAAGKTAKAVEALNRLEGLIGITEEASMQKQKLWLQAGKEKEAIGEVEALAKAKPKETKYNRILAQTYMKTGDLKKAKRHYDQVLANDPDAEYIHISLAQYYKAAGDNEQAYRELKEEFSKPELDCETKAMLLSSFYTKEEFYTTQASHVLDLLETSSPQCKDDLLFLLYTGEMLYVQGKYDAAAGKFKASIALDSSVYQTWANLLVCLYNSDTAGKETAAYALRAQRLFPMQNLPYYLLANTAFRDKDYEEAIRQLGQNEKVGFSDVYMEAQTYQMMAECYHELGNDGKTFAYYDKLLALTPNDTFALNNYAYYLALSGTRLEDALRMIEKAVEMKQNSSSFFDTYAWVLFKMGRYKEARVQMERSLKLEDSPSDTQKEHWKAILEKSNE